MTSPIPSPEQRPAVMADAVERGWVEYVPLDDEHMALLGDR